MLRAIFGEKASDVKDTSLRVPTGTKGTVIDVQVFTRDGIEKDSRAKEIEQSALNKVRKDLNEEYKIVEGATFERLRGALSGQPVHSGPGVKKGDVLTDAHFNAFEREEWFRLKMADASLNELLEKAEAQLKDRKKSIEERFEDKKRKLQSGDDLAPGVLKIVKVHLAVKRRIQPGIRWQVGTVTRGLFLPSCLLRTCLMMKAVIQWISFSILWVCLHG